MPTETLTTWSNFEHLVTTLSSTAVRKAVAIRVSVAAPVDILPASTEQRMAAPMESGDQSREI